MYPSVRKCLLPYGWVLTLRLLFLLQAASFGKSFLTDMPPQAFVSMCRTLRVLNAVRDYMVGVALTYGQYPFHILVTSHVLARSLSSCFHFTRLARLSKLCVHNNIKS